MQSSSSDFVGILVFFAIFGGMCLVFVAIRAAICFLLYRSAVRVPQECRQLEPVLVWLLMIPMFNALWNFFVFPSLSRSIRQAYENQGWMEGGDCGEALGWWFCGVYALNMCLAVFGIIPLIGILALPFSCISWLVYLVLLIVYLVKVNELAMRLPNRL